MKRKDIQENKSSISSSGTYQEIGEYWDSHDLAEIWDETESAEFEVDIQSSRAYYPVDRQLSQRITSIAKDRGVSGETLVNLWVNEKVIESERIKTLT